MNRVLSKGMKLPQCFGLIAFVTLTWPLAVPCNTSAQQGPSASIYLNLANNFLEQEDYAKAIDPYRKALALKPSSAAHFGLGVALYKTDRYEQALPEFLNAIEMDPRDPEYCYWAGVTRYQLKQYEKALTLLSDSARLDPKAAYTFHYIGEVYLNGYKQYERAIAAFRRAAELDPDDARTRNEFGLALDGLKQYDTALKQFQQAVHLKPTEPLYVSNLGIEYLHLGKTSEAQQVAVQLAKLDPQKAEALKKQISAGQQSGSTESDLAQGRKLIDTKKYEAALPVFARVITESSNPDERAYANFAIGWIDVQTKKYQESLPWFREALRLQPSNEQANLYTGLAMYKLTRFSDAQKLLEAALRAKPDDALAWWLFGSTDVHLGHREAALWDYQKLQKFDQDLATNLYEEIFDADTQIDEHKKPSASERAEGYKNLDRGTLLKKAHDGDDAAMKVLSDRSFAQRDSANGMEWLIKAAEKGDPELEETVGHRFENATPEGTEEARKWYRKAGEHSRDSAQLAICQSYASQIGLDESVFPKNGQSASDDPIPPIRGAKPDVDEAFRWCERASDQGMYLAEWNLGVLYAKGNQDHPADVDEAYFWLKAGEVRAGVAFREKVGRKLSETKRAEIEKRAANFHPSPMQMLHDRMLRNAAQKNEGNR